MTSSVDRPIRIRLGKAIFDLQTCQLSDLSGQPIAVREKSLRVLEVLAARNGETVEKDALISTVWSGRSVSDDSLVQCIKDIRTVLADHDRQLLRTSVGRGYSLNGLRELSNEAGERPKILLSQLAIRGDDPALSELADVIVEELVVTLSPRAGHDITIDENQRESVDYLISGRASLSENRFRVFLQIVSARSRDVVFAQTWSFDSREIEAENIPTSIAEKIDSVLRIHIFNNAGKEHLDRPNDALDTQELMAKAAYHMSRINMSNRNIARDALTVAIEREPENAMALAMRVASANILVLQEGTAKIPDSREFCVAMADRAIGIAPNVDFVLLARGCVRLWSCADHDGARADFYRALEVSPSFHLVHQFLAISEILTGEHASGIARARKIIELGTVNNPRYPHYLALLALGQLLLGDAAGALKSSLEGHERAPEDPWCKYVYAACAAHSDTIPQSERFQQVLKTTELPFTHFRDLPFTDQQDVDMLEARLSAVGYPNPS